MSAEPVGVVVVGLGVWYARLEVDSGAALGGIGTAALVGRVTSSVSRSKRRCAKGGRNIQRCRVCLLLHGVCLSRGFQACQALWCKQAPDVFDSCPR
jgi:hypothetical protein